jgi:hypothetical protein
MELDLNPAQTLNFLEISCLAHVRDPCMANKERFPLQASALDYMSRTKLFYWLKEKC